jgi:hypothetical protein
VQILRDVDRERLQRGHIEDLRPPGDLLAYVVSAIKTIDADEEPSQRLPRASRRRDERVRPRRNLWPAVALGRSRPLRKTPPEPLRNRGMEAPGIRGGQTQLLSTGGDGGHPPIVPESCDTDGRSTRSALGTLVRFQRR